MKRKSPKLTAKVLDEIYRELTEVGGLPERRCPECGRLVYVMGDTGEKDMIMYPCYDCLTK